MLYSEYIKKANITAIDFNKMIMDKISPPLKLDSKITFGLYRGRTVKEVLHNDIGYMRWIRDSTKIKLSKEVKQVINNMENLLQTQK